MNNIVNFLQNNDNFLILTHERPDGDTIGCASALCLALREIGKRAFVAKNPEITPRYLLFCQNLFPEKDDDFTVITVDIASKQLIPKEFANLKISARIDHHETEADYAEISYVDPTAAACGEIIWEIIELLGVTPTRAIADAIYIAIATDTGCFRYSSTSAKTHKIAARLIEYGANKTTLNNMIYSSLTRAHIEIQGAVMQNMEFIGKVSIAKIPLSLVEKTNATEDDLEGISSLSTSIVGIDIGLTIYEKSDHCKISVRTHAPYLANEICKKFNGGGHPRAGGCKLETGDMNVARQQLLSAIEGLYPEIMTNL